MTVRKLIIVRKPKSPISEQYRTIRTNLEFMAVDDGFGTIEQAIEIAIAQYSRG